MNVPFILATGYNIKVIPPAYAGVVGVEKPVFLRQLDLWSV